MKIDNNNKEFIKNTQKLNLSKSYNSENRENLKESVNIKEECNEIKNKIIKLSKSIDIKELNNDFSKEIKYLDSFKEELNKCYSKL